MGKQKIKLETKAINPEENVCINIIYYNSSQFYPFFAIPTTAVLNSHLDAFKLFQLMTLQAPSSCSPNPSFTVKPKIFNRLMASNVSLFLTMHGLNFLFDSSDLSRHSPYLSLQLISPLPNFPPKLRVQTLKYVRFNKIHHILSLLCAFSHHSLSFKSSVSYVNHL